MNKSQALVRMKNIRDAMDLIIEYLKDGGAADIRTFNTWLGKQSEVTQDALKPKQGKES